MRTKNIELTEAQPGDEIETDRGPATVLAAGGSREEIVEQIERLAGGYRLYSYGFDGEPDSLVGVYDTLEEAKGKMRSISHDMDPKLFFYVMRDDEVVMGDPDAWGPEGGP